MHKGKFLYFFYLCVRKVNILMTVKPCVSVNVAIPVELRQPRANSLAVDCDGSSLGEGLSRRVNSARLMQPRKR